MNDRSPLVEQELREQGWVQEPFRASFLAAGEYNENYLVETDFGSSVFRINHGTQLGLDNQIEYEFGVLQAVAQSGVTPRPFFVASRSSRFPRGYLLMEYLPGRPLDYRSDTPGAARCFAKIHALPAEGHAKPLLEQAHPVRDIIDECDGLLARARPHDTDALTLIRRYRERIVDPLATTDFPEPMCIVNTEVNSGNFVVSDEVRLVDWEKAVRSHRYQDLGHFLVSTTTLWKSDYRFDEQNRLEFLRAYHNEASLAVSLDELSERTRVLEKTILLRAFSWVYMALGEYASGTRSLTSDATHRTMSRYMAEIDSFLVV